jgi:hypothetical protein
MKSPRLLALLVLGLTATSAAFAKDAAPAGAPTSPVVIRELLVDFLTHNSDLARHENFWADDVVYTSAMGVVRTKPDIMKNVREAPAKTDPTKPAPVYSAEDINIRPYNGFAALTFRLVARQSDGTVDYYRNSGTVIYRDGRWQVVTWQATKVPEAKPVN